MKAYIYIYRERERHTHTHTHTHTHARTHTHTQKKGTKASKMNKVGNEIDEDSLANGFEGMKVIKIEKQSRTCNPRRKTVNTCWVHTRASYLIKLCRLSMGTSQLWHGCLWYGTSMFKPKQFTFQQWRENLLQLVRIVRRF